MKFFWRDCTLVLGLIAIMLNNNQQSGTLVEASSSSSRDSIDGPIRVDVSSATATNLYSFKWNKTFEGEYFRSITGLTYDPSVNRYYAVSEADDDPNRFFTLHFPLTSRPSIVDYTNLTATIFAPSVTTVTPISTIVNEENDSPQAIVLKPSTSELFVAHSNNDIARYRKTNGNRLDDLNYGQNTPTFRPNEGISGLSFDRSRSNILWAVSSAGALNDDMDFVRFMAIDITYRDIETQYVYVPDSGYSVESIISLDDNGSFLVLERTNGDAKLYYTISSNALNVNDYGDTLDMSDIDHFLKKKHLATFSALSIFGLGPIGNFEAMTLKSIDHERATIVLVSNNGFVQDVETQFLVMRLDLNVIGVEFPIEETDPVNNGGKEERAITAKPWVHPEDPQDSIIFASLGEGGIGIYALFGLELAREEGGNFYGIDILYGFEMIDEIFAPADTAGDGDGESEEYRRAELVDLVIVSDADDNTLKFYMIDPDRLPNNAGNALVDVTANSIDDGSLTNPRAIAAYTSPYTGKSFVFVANNRGTGTEIIQLEIFGREGKVDANEIRTIDLSGESWGMVVDRELGYLYVTVNGNNGGIFRFDAEPSNNGVNDHIYSKVAGYGSNTFDRDFTGLDIYYGEEYDGYLIASHPTDSTFAVFGRNDGNSYHGSFTLGQNVGFDIDRVDATEGVGLINVNLGREFGCGLLIVQDANDEYANFNTVGGKLVNENSNFKIVNMDSLRDRLPKKLRIDTQTWGPRRFALTRLIDGIAQEIYNELAQGDIPVRDAEALLGHLGLAAWYLYQPGSQRRRLMSPTGGRGEYKSYKKSLKPRRKRRGLFSNSDENVNVNVNEDKEDRELWETSIDLLECDASSHKSSRKADTEDAYDALEDFLHDLDDINAGTKNWEVRVEAIMDALPVDVNYRSSSSFH